MGMFVCGELAFRPMYFPKKDSPPCEGHSHHFDHVTIVFSGAVRVECRHSDGTLEPRVSSDYYAPQTPSRGNQPCVINIRKEYSHKITPLMENTYCGCVYFHRNPETGEVVSEPNGWEGAWC